MHRSLSAQVSYYSEFIRSHPGWEYAGVYSDEARTGTRDTREGFQMLLIALRELILNALIHRDYSIHTDSTPVTIRMFSDRFEIEKVVLWEQTGPSTYDGIVRGSEGNRYSVHIDTVHIRSSKCNCPFADGRRRVCKHMIALFFATHPEEAEEQQREIDEWEAEEAAAEAEVAEREKRLLKNITDYVNSMTEEEVREKLIEIMFANEVDDDKDEWGEDWDE